MTKWDAGTGACDKFNTDDPSTGITAGPRCYMSDVAKTARGDDATVTFENAPSTNTAFCAIDDTACEEGDTDRAEQAGGRGDADLEESLRGAGNGL